MDRHYARLKACGVLRRLLGGPNAARKAIFALLPVVLGAGLFLTAPDRPSTRSSLLETTQASILPLELDSPGTTSTAQTPATPFGEATTETTIAGLLTPAFGTDTPSVPGTAPASGTGTTPAALGTSRAGGTDGVSGGSESLDDGSAATPAAADGGSARTPVPTTETTSTPTTQAPEATTTTSTTTTTAPAPVRTGRARGADVEAEVVPLTNADRTAQGLGTLSRSSCLDSAASGFAEQMARNGVLAHNPGAGPAVLDCRPNATWGDNVGTAAPCDTAFLETQWMASPSHRRNILTGAFQLIGVGAWTDAQGGCWVQVLFSS